MPTETEAVELLEELGVTEYEARCFVALSRVGTATAKEVSDLSGVPRSRVYDAVRRLHERGLVDVQQSEPREYQALDTDRAIETLRDKHQSVLDEFEDALTQLERVETPEESGAWAIADAEHVTERIRILIEEGTEQLYVLVADERFEARTEFSDLVADASERGLDVVIEVPSAEVRSRVAETAPDATLIVTEEAWRDTPIRGKWLGGIVMVDRESVLVSAFEESPRPDDPTETAIWASGKNHGLVVGLRHLLSHRLDHMAEFDED